MWERKKRKVKGGEGNEVCAKEMRRCKYNSRRGGQE